MEKIEGVINVMENKGEILIYKTEKGNTKVDVFMDDGSVWMNQKSIAKLYATTSQNITKHIANIYKEGELLPGATCNYYLQVHQEGTRAVSRNTKFYNLDMILAIGYRVRSTVGAQFRSWATDILKEYMQKGFALNDERLKNPKRFGQDYFDELLERIRDIRSSEQRFYQKVKDLYKLASDYNPSLQSTKDFFATVQNKMLYSVTGHTAAEIVSARINSEKMNLGLTSFKGVVVRKGDILIAKNYLTHDELDDLNRLVTMFLDHAEDMAKHNRVMTMKDWENTVNEFLTFRRREILQGKGSISHEAMERKALREYAKYYSRKLQTPEDDYEQNAIILPNPEKNKTNEN